MNNRLITFSTFFVLIGIIILLAINALSYFKFDNQERYVSRNDVRGSAVVYKDKIYTLNFEQQNKLIDYLNMSLSKSKGKDPVAETEVKKIYIYLFSSPDVEIKVLGKDEKNNLIMSVAAWEKLNPIYDTTQGSFVNLLSTTYDP